MADIFEVEKILGDRVRKGQTEYKIRWKKFGPKGDSWEPEENLLDCGDILNAYKAQKSSKAAPTPRRSQRTNPTPRTTTKPETKVIRSTRTKVTTTSVQKQTKKSLENDFVTPRPPRASMRQRVLELQESAQKTLQEIRNNQRNEDGPDSVSFSKTPESTQRARNRLSELKRWLDQHQSSETEHEGASWWIVALCALCFISVVVIIVWYSPALSDESSSGA